MKDKFELRFNDVELTGSEDDLRVSGYVNKTNQWSQTLGTRKKFVERIEQGAFRKALQNGNEIHFYAEHDPAKILASTRNGSLSLREDEEGLFMSAEIAPTSWGLDYHTLIKTGIIQNMSFGMKVLKDSWRKLENGLYERSISDIQLFEVSAVRNPAYVQSTISARSIDIVDDPQINISEEKEMFNQNTLDPYYAKLKEFDNVKDAVRKAPEQTEKQETRGFEQFLRDEKGEERAMLTTTNTGGGTNNVIIPTHVYAEVIKQVKEVAPMFARTRNFTPVSGNQEVLVENQSGSAAFIGEMVDITPNDFSLRKIKLEQKRVGTAIELSEHLINDTGINIVEYTEGILARRYGRLIENNILFGTGQENNQFEGILADTVAIPNYEIGQRAMTLNSLTDIKADDLMDMYQSIHRNYHNDACWVMSRKAFNQIVKLKTHDNFDGFYYLDNDITKKIHYELFGFPVFVHEEMDNVALNPDNKLILFGNFFEGYATMDKRGTRLRKIADDSRQALRGSQLFMLDGYMDGKIMQPDAFQIMKFTTV